MSFRYQYKSHEKTDCEKRKGHKQRKFTEKDKFVVVLSLYMFP